MLDHLRSRFSRDDGFALIDSLVGVIALTVIVTMLVTTTVAAAHAMSAAASQSERQMYLRSLVNDLGLNPDMVPTSAGTANVPFGDTIATVSTLRLDDGADRTIIRAAVNATDGVDCSASLNPLAGTKTNPTCLVAEVSVDRRVLGPAFTPIPTSISQAGVDTASGANTVQGVLGTFTPETGVTEVKWVIGVKATSGAARISLYQSGARISVSAFDSGADTYLYGTLTVTPAQPVTMVWEGEPGSAHNALVYATAP